MPHPSLLHPEPLPLRQATADPYPTELLKHSSVSVSVGSLGPGAHKVLFVSSKSLFPQCCVSSGSSVVGLMATSSTRAYAVPKSAAPRAPAPAAVRC